MKRAVLFAALTVSTLTASSLSHAWDSSTRNGVRDMPRVGRALPVIGVTGERWFRRRLARSHSDRSNT